MSTANWLRDRDSNPDTENQNLVSYRLDDPSIYWRCAPESNWVLKDLQSRALPSDPHTFIGNLVNFYCGRSFTVNLFSSNSILNPRLPWVDP
ncbi:hypothetical protein UFOVP1071_134 [uncultured Caudovirales phage]|uniref:Uncharacterized protein n=1 Tax=uncultured Caudovirales phage TaxID=2100421 RepID=A0A6J5QKU2_9CAUD|nr:hypothetical protein UFOVP1071_134 [uncultured Caudovirales phage]